MRAPFEERPVVGEDDDDGGVCKLFRFITFFFVGSIPQVAVFIFVLNSFIVPITKRARPALSGERVDFLIFNL